MFNGYYIVAYKKDGPAMPAGDILHFAQAFLLELGVPHCQYLIDDEDLRLEMRRHGKGQPDIHAGAVTLHRRVDISFDAREIHDLVESAFDLMLTHAENGPIQKDILPSAEIGM